MTTQKLIGAGLTIAGLTLFGGIAAKKPVLINAGMNLGFISGGVHLVSKQNQTAIKQQLAILASAESSELATIKTTLEKLQKQIALIPAESSELVAIKTALEKLKQQLERQRTRQNATLSKVSKLDHKQKVTAIAIAQKVDELIAMSDRNLVTQPAPIVEEVEQPSALATLRFPVTRIYIDGNNFRFAAKDMGIDVDYKAFRLVLMPKNGKAVFHYYTGVFPTPTYTQKRFVSRLQEYGYQVSQLPIIQHQDGTYKTVGDDVKISTDMTDESQPGDRVILVSGDGDFVPAIEKLQNKGVKVTIAGHKDSINYDLRRIADNFLDLDTVKYEIAKHTKLVLA